MYQALYKYFYLYNLHSTQSGKYYNPYKDSEDLKFSQSHTMTELECLNTCTSHINSAPNTLGSSLLAPGRVQKCLFITDVSLCHLHFPLAASKKDLPPILLTEYINII